MSKALALILAGDGINCENETALAFKAAGAETKTLSINELAASPECLAAADILALPGGFSYGDEIHSGQVYALKMQKLLGNKISNFLAQGKLVLGICNGFQILVKLGLLPNPITPGQATLTKNSGQVFVDKWVNLNREDSVCEWTKGLANEIPMPARHGEGRLVLKGGADEQKKGLEILRERGQIVFTYQEDFNGSIGRIAGLTDPTGRVLGLMPHPEAALEQGLNPLGSAVEAQGIFENAVKYALKNKTSPQKGSL